MTRYRRQLSGLSQSAHSPFGNLFLDGRTAGFYGWAVAQTTSTARITQAIIDLDVLGPLTSKLDAKNIVRQQRG